MNVTSFEEQEPRELILSLSLSLSLSLQITLSLLLGMPGSRGAEWR
jgi:hypothetical protein